MDKSEVKPIVKVNNIRCKIENLPITVANLVSKEFAVKAPNYWFSNKFKNGQWDGTIKFFTRPANVFPTGLLPKVLEVLKELEIEAEIQDLRQNVENFKLNTVSQDYSVSESKDSREYQVETINKIITGSTSTIPFMRGIVNIATNGGKTTIAEALIKELYPVLVQENSVFLFVTHSKEIAVQAKKSIEQDLGIEVGMIGDGKWNLKNVTVAIVTTLYKRIKKPEFLDLKSKTVGFVADECHHSVSTSWYDVFNELEYASIRIGLTGTVDSTNPVNKMRLHACTGDIINKISNEYLIEQGYSAKPICVLFTISSPELGNMNYQDAYSLGIVESEERIDHIVEICKKETASNHSVLILVEHVEHGEILKEELDTLNKNVHFTNGTLSSEKRQGLLDDLKNGNIDVLISTSILDEGVDVSNINAIIYARGMKSSRKLLQGLGRGLRKKSDNSKLRFYDFIDDMNNTLLEHSLARYNTLKQEKFEIKRMSLDEFKTATWEDLQHE